MQVGSGISGFSLPCALTPREGFQGALGFPSSGGVYHVMFLSREAQAPEVFTGGWSHGQHSAWHGPGKHTDHIFSTKHVVCPNRLGAVHHLDHLQNAVPRHQPHVHLVGELFWR